MTNTMATDVSPMTFTVTTAKGMEVEIVRRGAETGNALVYFHGLVGLLPSEPMLDELAKHVTVYSPVWPGYGQFENEVEIEDMLDFALMGWDIVDALGLEKPAVMGHSFGAMIAAEMACIARHDLSQLVLAAPFGLWLDEHPMPDPFGVLPFDLVDLLIANPKNADALAPEGDLGSDDGLASFMISNSRRFGTAGKIMFPIPNRRLSKRLYRLSAPTLVLLAEQDRLVQAEAYGKAWGAAIEHAEVTTINGGHLLNIENPVDAANSIIEFLTPS